MESWRIKLKGQNLGALAASSTGRVTASLGAARMCASRDLSQVNVTRIFLQIQPFRWSKKQLSWVGNGAFLRMWCEPSVENYRMRSEELTQDFSPRRHIEHQR